MHTLRPVYELHDEKLLAAGFIRIVRGDDIRMREAGDRTNFASETSSGHWIDKLFRRQHLDSRQAIQFDVANLIDDAHPALSQDIQDLIPAVTRLRRDIADAGTPRGILP